MRSLSNKPNTVQLPKVNPHGNIEEVAGAQDTIYLCNFRVSVDGEWLCLKELQDLEIQDSANNRNDEQGTVANYGISHSNDNYEQKNDREWVNYCRCLFMVLILKRTVHSRVFFNVFSLFQKTFSGSEFWSMCQFSVVFKNEFF